MNFFVVFTVLFSLGGITSSSIVTGFHNEEELRAAHEEAQYHLEGLQKTFARISTLQKRSLRAKRDQEAVQSKRKTDFLFDSLVNFCNRIQDFDQNNPNTRTETEVSSTSESGEVKENWIEPAVNPIRVQAIRLNETTVGIQFYIIESTPSVITRIAGLDTEILLVPKGHGSRDHGAFVIDTSRYCQYGDYDEIDNQFVFEAKDTPMVAVSLRINVCKFDKFQDMSLPWENRTWETRYGPRREDIQLPKLRISSNISKDIVLTPGKNISFEMIAHMDRGSFVNLYAVFYDRKSRSMIANSFTYNIGQENYLPSHQSDLRDILKVDLLQASVIKNATTTERGGDEDGDIKEIKSRVTLITESGELTGKLFMSLSDRFGTFSEPNVVSSVFLGSTLNVRKPNRNHVFPRRKVLWQTQKFLCDHEGNKLTEKVGQNCTIACGVVGRDLSTLTISKKGASVPIYGKTTQTWSDRLYSIVDVGPATSDIEGAYVCTVTDARGNYEESKEIHLYTSGFPKIDANKTTVEVLGNGMTKIKCVVSGRLPIDVDIELSVDAESISLSDRDNPMQKNMDDGQGTVVTLNVPTEDLYYPARVIRFHVRSEFGDDHHSIYLDTVIPDHRGYAKMAPKNLQ